VEADEHAYEAIYRRLPDDFGFEPQVSLEDEVYHMFELLMQPHVKTRIEEKQHLIIPKTWWSGEKKVAEQLELRGSE
jgi:hypothetical protein